MDRKKKKQQGVAKLTLDNIDFKRKSTKGDKKDHFVILKGRFLQEDINIVNIYEPNIGPTKYKRKILEGFKIDIQ